MRKTLLFLLLAILSINTAFAINIDYWRTYRGIEIDEVRKCIFVSSSIDFEFYPQKKVLRVKGDNYYPIGDDAILALRNTSNEVLTYGSLSKADSKGWRTYDGDYDVFVNLISENEYLGLERRIDYVISFSDKQYSKEMNFAYYFYEFELNRRIEHSSYKDVYGEPGPAGGFIILDKGSYSEGWRYIEAAPYDVREVNGVYSCDGTDPMYKMSSPYVGSTYERERFNEYLGDAKKHTFENDTVRAIACRNLVYNGYSDWLLPTNEELELITHNLDIGEMDYLIGNHVRPIRYF